MKRDELSNKSTAHISGTFSIKKVRDFILDIGLSSNDTLLLNTYDFDDIVLDHREVYKESLTVPYFIIGVLIKEAPMRDRSFTGQVIIIKDDIASREELSQSDDSEYYNGETVYRCGWCGNLVDYDGADLQGDKWIRQSNLLKKFGRDVNVISVNGRCCPQEMKT
jgi:hypothetical protein